MPSKDLHHLKHPKLNESLDLGKHGETTGTQRILSPTLLRLADRLGVDPDELAAKIPADTLRRTQYAMLEEKTPDGKTIFKHDLGIVEGRTALTRK